MTHFAACVCYALNIVTFGPLYRDTIPLMSFVRVMNTGLHMNLPVSFVLGGSSKVQCERGVGRVGGGGGGKWGRGTISFKDRYALPVFKVVS